MTEDKQGAEDRLIADLVGRANAQVKLHKGASGYQTAEQISLEQIRKKNEEALIHLSANKLNVIISGLAEGLDAITKNKSKDDTPEKIMKYQASIVDLMAKCMAHSWDNIKAQFRSVQGIDEKEAIRLKEKEEQILPPPLEENLAKFILNQVMQLLLRPEPEAHDTAARLLFQLSATNYESVFSRISEAIHAIVNGKDTDDTTASFALIECLNLNSRRLSELLERISKNAPHFKKDKQQNILSQVLRKAIWNWIDNYPMEFVSLCQSNARFPGNPDTLFDVLDGWSKKNKNNFWPLQTMFLILSPDIVLKISLNKERGQEVVAKEKFLDTIKKALKTPKTAEMAAVCYVDICKASTFVSRQDVSALRYLVPGIENDLKEKLFDSQSPFRKGGDNGPIDVELMTDCLVSSFRIGPKKTLGSLFLECVHPSAPPHFKMVLVKGLLRIAKEGTNLPWNPSISEVYPVLAGHLRALFLEYLQGLKTYNMIKNSTDKKVKPQVEKLAYDIQILGILIELFDTDPNFVLFPLLKTQTQDLEDVRSIMVGLCYCTALFSMPDVSDIAPRTLLALHQPGNIEKWSSKSTINGFWEITSSVNVALGNALIEQKDIKPDQIQKLVALIESILVRRNQFLERFKESHIPEPHLKDVRFQGSTKLEVALLVHLSSAEPDICSKCATCFGLLCDEVDIFGEADEGNSIVANYSVYRKLSTTGIFQVGRQHQQKGIRMLLRRVDIPTSGNFAAWEDVYNRWKTATEPFLAPEEDKNKKGAPVKSERTPAEIQQWQNYLGFLVGLSGVTLNRETTVKVTTEDPKKKGKGPINTEKTVKLTDSFIVELLDLLVCDSAFVRETVMSLTGSSLSPASYAVLFRNLHDEMQGLFGDAGQVDFTERNVLFVDQAVSIVKHILESPQESEDLSLVTSFESLIILFMKVVSQLLSNSTSLRIKKNMCALLENMMYQRQSISFKHEYDFRNHLVEAVVEWTTEFALGKSGGNPSPSSPEPLPTVSSEKGIPDSPAVKEAALCKRLQKELDVSCIGSVGLLLRGLPLPADTQQVKFMKYFSFFTTLLTRCKQDADSPTQLAENAIKALSNLLSANIQAGLEYFVTMGYHDDYDTRSAFLKVISNILAQGTEFDQLEEGEKYDKLLELLLAPEMSVVLALGEATQITEADEVAHLLVRLFEAHERGLSCVKMVVAAEVNITETANTLFRRNSVATKVLSSYTKLIGPNYLKDTLLPVFKEIMGTPNASYEIDLELLAPGEDLSKNAANLVKLIKLVIRAISNSAATLPLPLHEICNFMYKLVGERYPGNERLAVGGFMFLRFLSPALVAPEGYGLVAAGLITKEIRRGLVLVTKFLQHLANGLTNFREPFMTCLDACALDHKPVVDGLCDTFAIITPGSPPGKSVHIGSEQQEEDLIALHHHISMSLEKITKILDTAGNRDTADKLASVLQKLGPPPEQVKKTTAPAIRAHGGGVKNNNLYEEFMRQNADKNTDSIKQKKIFFLHGVSKEKLPVLYFITKRIDNTIDMDLLLVHILKTLQEIHNKSFVVVVDASFFGPDNQIAIPWFVKYIRHFPDAAGDNLKHIFLLNPNHWFKKYSKRISKHVGLMQKKITFVTNALKLNEFIVDSENALPSSTLAVENDVKATFTNVHKLSSHHGMKEVILRINSDLFQLSTIKLHPVLGKTTTLIDLHHIATVQEVTHSSQDHEFVVKYDENGGQKSMTLRSTSSQQIIQALKAAKTRFNLAKPSANSSRVFRPSDIPGTLLNVALLNLGSTRGTLRVAAYNMLTSLCKNSNFAIKLFLLDAPSLCIPKNNTAFVVRVSEKLARTESALTLEFLLECLHGIGKVPSSNKFPSVYLVLDYMQPWLSNLALFCQKNSEAQEKHSKVVEIINSLIDLTIRETTLKLNILASVWRTIGRVDNPELVTLATKACLKKSIESGIGSMKSDIIGEIVYTMAAENAQLVAGKVIAKALKALHQTSQKPTSDLSESEVWPKLSVLLRLLLILAFDDMISVQNYLPELFHIVLMLFATGSAVVRASSHGLLVNTVHSLYTSLVSPENKLQSLHFHLADFGQISFRIIFGLGGSNVHAFSAPDPTTHAKELEKIPIMNVDVVANSMLGVLSSCATHNNAMYAAWYSRWIALTTSAALVNNPAAQARAFIVLGVLCRSPDLVTDDLMDEVLSTLKNVCANAKSLQDNNDLLVGILQCLTRIYRYLPHSSRYSRTLFWIGITLVQLYEPRVYTAAIALLEVIITVLDSHDSFFKDVGMAKTLLAARTPIQAPLQRLDAVTGITFESNFSFAVACHLLKGLRHPSTKTATARLLTTFLGITAKRGVGSEILGYLTALLPTEGIPANLDQLMPISGDGAKSVFQYLFSDSMIPDVDHCALLFTLLTTILQNTDREHEQLFIYEALREGISYMPSAFPVTYKTLIPKMSTVVASGQNDKIVESVLVIMESMFSFSMESALNKNRLNIAHLKKLGFHGIPECGLGFNRGFQQLNEAIMKVVTEAIGTLLQPKPVPHTMIYRTGQVLARLLYNRVIIDTQ